MQFERDLTILFDDTSTIKEFSRELQDYQRDSATILLPVSGFLNVGLYKPFDVLYFEGITFNTNSSIVTGEYWNGSAFVPLEFFIDQTDGFKRSAFLEWKKSEGWAKTTISGDELFWVRFSVDIATSSMDVRALNILFANDNELLKENSTILERFLPEGQVSFASLHSRVRDLIVQSLNNRGQFTKKESSEVQTTRGLINDVAKWDLLRKEQVKEAAINLALATIYNQASDAPDDVWAERHRFYNDRGQLHLQTVKLALDRDDDGVEDESENRMTSAINVQRI